MCDKLSCSKIAIGSGLSPTRQQLILTWRREYRDQYGGVPGWSRFHCTPEQMKPATIPKRDRWGV